MKLKTKEDKGITLVALVVTIVIMLILASVAAYTGINTYEYSKANKFVVQLQLIQKKVDNIAQESNIINLGATIENTMPNYSKIEIAITNARTNQEIKSTDTISDFKYFSKEDLREQLDVEDIQDEILVNFQTREVVSLNGAKYEGKRYYTQYLLPQGQKIIPNVTIDSTLSFTLDLYINGLNASAKITNINRTIGENEKTITNGIIKYKLLPDDDTIYVSNDETKTEKENNEITYANYNEEQGYWENISNNCTTITKSGRYVFVLLDSVDTIPKTIEIEVKLANAPNMINGMIQAEYTIEEGIITRAIVEGKGYDYSKSIDNWAYSTDNTNYYIWIPRFVYNTEGDNTTIKFLKGNSNIPTDNSDISIQTEWTLPSQFTKNGQSLRGIWLEVDLLDETKYNYIDNVIENDITQTLSNSLETDIIPII